MCIPLHHTPATSVIIVSNDERNRRVNPDLEVPHELVTQVRLTSGRQTDLRQKSVPRVISLARKRTIARTILASE